MSLPRFFERRGDFRRVVSTSINRGEIEEALNSLDVMEKKAETIPDSTERIQSLSSLVLYRVETLARRQRFEDAIKATERLEKRVVTMEPGLPRTEAIKSVIECRVGLRDFPGALKLALEHSGTDARSRMEMFLAFLGAAKTSQLEAKKSTAKLTKDQEASLRQCLETITREVKRAELSEPKVDQYLIDLFSMLGEFDKAQRILNRIDEGTLGPPEKFEALRYPTALASIAREQADVGQIDEARQNYRRILDWIEEHPEVVAANDMTSFFFLLAAEEEQGDLAEAGRKIEKVKPGLFRAFTYQRLAEILEEKGDLQGSKDARKRNLLDLEFALKNHQSEPVDPRWIAKSEDLLKRIVTAQASLGQYEQATETLGKIQDTYEQNQLTSRLAFLRAEAGDIVGATEWAASLRDPLFRALALTGVTEAVKAKVR